ncbi:MULTISPECIES: hypothetical protein [Mesorhizobium]|uniref:hypothetical protein n=1 Tax=Mesorhizobium australicum TaxID=536018 RepID=UPI003336FB30
MEAADHAQDRCTDQHFTGGQVGSENAVDRLDGQVRSRAQFRHRRDDDIAGDMGEVLPEALDRVTPRNQPFIIGDRGIPAGKRGEEILHENGPDLDAIPDKIKDGRPVALDYVPECIGTGSKRGSKEQTDLAKHAAGGFFQLVQRSVERFGRLDLIVGKDDAEIGRPVLKFFDAGGAFVQERDQLRPSLAEELQCNS